jgi:hypothetical protein
MPNDDNKSVPRQFHGVMLSSTFSDLERHREALINAVESQDLHAVAMENDSAKPVDIIDSSLRMVRDTSAYIGVIGRRYGQSPPSEERNPRKLSITEIEFNEAQRLGRSILLFIMGNDHPPGVEEETNSGKKKLSRFRERPSRWGRIRACAASMPRSTAWRISL